MGAKATGPGRHPARRIMPAPAFGLWLALAVAALAPAPGAAQDRTQDRTLADIRQELTVLHVEIQRLKRELSTTGGPGLAAAAGSSLPDRVAAIEAELQRLTAQTEALVHRVDQVVSDGTNRIGDLEFRLCELEPDCDISKLSETTTLGGAGAAPATPAGTGGPIGAGGPPAGGSGGGALPEAPQTELAVGEQADFDAAMAAVEAGEFQRAADLFAAFNQTYPGSPLAPRAHLNRGRALDQLGDTREAARAYLDGFTLAPTGPEAAETLYQLGAALGRLGQTSQACVTLGEVAVRFPASEAVAAASAEMTKLGCS